MLIDTTANRKHSTLRLAASARRDRTKPCGGQGSIMGKLDNRRLREEIGIKRGEKGGRGREG